MFFLLLILFFAVPLTELSILTWLSQQHGLGTTIFIVFATGVIGAALARWQGVSTVFKIQQRMKSGQAPTQEILDGVLILVAGAVLLTPGLLTDAFGFSLLLPPVRRLVGRGLAAWFKSRVKVQSFGTGMNAQFGGSGGSLFPQSPFGAPFGQAEHPEASSAGGPIIDAEFRRLDDDAADESSE